MTPPDPGTSVAADTTAVGDYREALEDYIAATNTHDFDHVRPLLHTEVVFRFSDADCAGVPAAQHYFEHAWSVVKDERYEAVDVTWRLPTPTTAVASYTYRWTGFTEGQHRSGTGSATNVFVTNAEGRWILAHEHLSPSH